MISVV